MRTIGGIIVGILLFFPGIVFLQWFFVHATGFYDAMTLTDGCLLIIIILLCIVLVHLPHFNRATRQQRRPNYGGQREPKLEYLSGPGATNTSRPARNSRTARSDQQRRTASSGRKTTNRRQRRY